MRNKALLLALALLSFLPSMAAAETYEQNFDASTSLPQDWNLLGGTFYTYDTGEFASYYMNTESDYSHSKKNSICCAFTLTGQYLVSPKITGEVSFYVRPYRSKRKASITVYRCSDDGQTVGEEFTAAYKSWSSSNTNVQWQKVTLNLGKEGTRLAFNLNKVYFDDFVAEVYKAEEEIRSLSVIQVENLLDTCALLADEDNKVTLRFKATVRNTGNVDLTPEEEGYTLSLLNADGYALHTQAITEAIAAGAVSEQIISATLTANSLITGQEVQFAVRENFTKTQQLCPDKFQIMAYLPQLALYDTDPAVGYPEPLTYQQVINFGNQCQPVSGTFYVRNAGNAPLVIPSIVAPENFSVSPAELAVPAGQTASFTITMDILPDSYGYHEGDVILYPKGLDEVHLSVKGVTRSPETIYIDFNDQKFPENWTVNDAWRIDFASYGSTDYYALQYQSPVSSMVASSLVSPRLVVEDGETMQFRAKAYDLESQYQASLAVAYSSDRKTWTPITLSPDTLAADFQTYELSDIPAGTYYIRFKALNAAVDDIFGFRLATDTPLLSFYASDPAAPDSQPLPSSAEWDFGSASQSVSHTFYVKNSGTGILDVTSITAPDGFQVSPSTMSLAADEVAPLTLTMLAGEPPFGAKSGRLHMESTAAEPFELLVTGFNRNPAVCYVDFEDGQFPKGWVVAEGWNVATSYGLPGLVAENHASAVASPLITSLLECAEDDSLQFDAQCYGQRDWYPPTLRISYSADRQTWDSIADWSEELTNSLTRYTVRNIPAGRWYFRLEGANVLLDNLQGGLLTEAAEHDIVFVSSDLPAEATVNHPYLASVTIANLGTSEEMLSAKLVIGEDTVALSEVATLQPDSLGSLSVCFVPHLEQSSVASFVCVETASGLVLCSDSLLLDILPETANSLSRHLSGLLRDEEGVPVAGASLHMQSGDVFYEGQSDAEGHFDLTIFQGTLDYQLTIRHEECDVLTDSISFHYQDLDSTFVLHRLVPVGVDSMTLSSRPSQPTFDLQGRPLPRVGRPSKGVFLLGRKKILVR
ncbi:MAG: DUF1573 domain-containing protein [Bacteroidaceae bacterium]|nr:DUF1573 domain-containing protein [Bacteroidaceae bacterium]